MRLRFLLAALIALPLGGCVTSGDSLITGSVDGPDASRYGARPNEAHPLPATNVAGVNRKYLKQTVNFRGDYAPGTIVVDTNNRFLYLVQPGGKATRYGIGVGKAGLAWGGSATVGRKAGKCATFSRKCKGKMKIPRAPLTVCRRRGSAST